MEVENLIPESEESEIGLTEVTVITGEGKDVTSKSIGSVVEDLMEDITTILTSETVSDSTPKKKLKENDMEVDGLSEENKENILHRIRQMSRKELEDLVLIKIVEALVKHSEAGKFRTQILEMQVQKDKMTQRVTHLQKQVMEMGKAVKLLLDNHNRDPNNLNQSKKRPPPIKFYRSVGLQVTIEPSFRNGPTKVIHISSNGVKPLNGTFQISSSINSSPATVTKRPGPKSLTDPKALNQTISKGLSQMNGHFNAAATSPIRPPEKRLISPTVVDCVDLTDDNTPCSTSTTTTTTLTKEGNNNGVHYRLVNSSPQGVHLLPTTHNNGQNYQRPLILTQKNASINLPSGGKPVQAVLIRNIPPKPTLPVPGNVLVGQTNYYRPLPVATIPNQSGPGGKTFRPQTTSASKKIQLPPYPLSTIVTATAPKGRPLGELPPKPTLTLTEQSDGIVLSWTMKLSIQNEEIASYQIYACQESISTSPGKTSSWKKVGDVKALPLPMACTLSQFTQGNRYFFIVRSVDKYGRSGPFCDPGPIILQKK